MLERRDDETADPDASGCGRTRSSSCICLVSVASAPDEDGANQRLRVGERCWRERIRIYFDDNEVLA
jgi:hypothetical protein